MTTATELADGPLQGLRVFEFGQLLAGSCVGTLLGDFGCQVVKVEPPLDDTPAAQSAFQGVLLALYARDVGGAAGQVVDASITDACFATHHARGENEDLLDELTGAWAAQHRPDELDRIVDGAGVVCAPVYDDEIARLRGQGVL